MSIGMPVLFDGVVKYLNTLVFVIFQILPRLTWYNFQ